MDPVHRGPTGTAPRPSPVVGMLEIDDIALVDVEVADSVLAPAEKNRIGALRPIRMSAFGVPLITAATSVMELVQVSLMRAPNSSDPDSVPRSQRQAIRLMVAWSAARLTWLRPAFFAS